MYWGALYDPAKCLPGIKCVNSFVGHIAPLVVMVIEYMMSVVPVFPPRRALVLFTYALAYSTVNLIVTKSRGKPVYGIMDWNSPGGIILPLAVPIFAQVFYFIMCLITKCKMRILGILDSEGNHLHLSKNKTIELAAKTETTAKNQVYKDDGN